ncbi:hypothetical protein [Aestuariibacter sp. A3R04]|uniref:hypothetical protein n=1 Tax=Aestuariibacter sp. A3R04 TaxID=2841571 RepID=UPI001C08B8FA|nr:hypothetical protein [Aestuariibacter sp. A3R04]MBU3020274.1 hypothetical protein [Aestuariibacter sp. A3R04]
MKTEYLCPVYRKWLQLHPEQARQHRLQQVEAALQYAGEGLHQKALEASKQAFEIAHAVVLSLQKPDQSEVVTKQDLSIFGNIAMHLANHFASNAECAEAANCLNGAQQQLRGIAPLFACHYDILMLIHTIDNTLAHAAACYERETYRHRQLH